LDRGAALDDEGDRGGPTLGRLLEGVSHERARCTRGVPVVRKLIEGGEGKLVGLGGIAISKARNAKLDIWRTGAASCVSGKHEPIDLFGNCIVLIDRAARGPERGHPLL
jgi:hypothetical protein